MISACVSGIVGQDAELKFVNGTAVMSTSIASRRWAKDKKVTDWVKVSFWGKRAESLTNHCRKGARVVVRGSLFVREYEKKDGGHGVSIELRADDVELFGGDKPKEHASVAARRQGPSEMEDDGF